MRQRFLSVVLVLCVCIFNQSVVHAQQEVPLMQMDVLAEESTSGGLTRNSAVPTPAEVYKAMIALKDQDAYKEGTIWTNDEPYSASKGYYRWKGGTFGGVNIVGAGCAAFAFVLSDAAFGSLPAMMYAAGNFKYEDIKPGDILRVNNDAHTVIVLEVSDVGVVVAEGNISTGGNKGRVHWGRAISKTEVMNSTSHYITRYPAGYIPPDDPDANISLGNGTLNGGLKWNLTKAGTLTISGNGAMPDYNSTGDQPWSENSSQIRKVVIGNGVTSIGSCAFWNCGVLSAEISSSVKTIGNNAFRGSSMIYAALPSSVKNIGDSAFRECKNLSSVTLSEGVEKIDQNAFRACTSLTSISLPASIGEVGAGAFFQCTAMTSVAFAPGSKQVKAGDNMFSGCWYLTSVTLPANINCIGEGMFQNCQGLLKVEIPKGAESIGGSAFASCTGLTAVIIPDSVTTIGIAAFADCPLKDLYFTGTEAQWNRISKIGDMAAALSKVTIHYNYIPAAKPNPGDGGSNNNSNGNPGSSGNSGNSTNQVPKRMPLAKGRTFTKSKITYKVIKAGKEVELKTSKSTAAKITINTVTGTDGVKYKVTSIGSKAMKNNKKVKSLVIGANVKTIGANAFSGCTKLTTVSFGKNVATIGTSAFKGCTSLKKTLTLPDSVKKIGASAFFGCSKITAVTIGKTSKSSLTTIGKSTFCGCKKLGKVTIRSKKLSSVGKLSFKSTKSSLKVKVPSEQLTKYKKILKKAGLKVKQVTK